MKVGLLAYIFDDFMRLYADIKLDECTGKMLSFIKTFFHDRELMRLTALT